MWETVAAINLPFGDGLYTTHKNGDFGDGLVYYWVYHIRGLYQPAKNIFSP